MALDEFGQRVQAGVIAESIWLLAHEVSLGHRTVYCPWGGQTSEHLTDLGYQSAKHTSYFYELSRDAENSAMSRDLEKAFLGVLESAGDLLRPESMTMLLARYAGMKL